MTSPLVKLTIYRDDSTTQVVFEGVKHWFWTAGNSVLTIARITNAETGAHEYIHWSRERICWFKDSGSSDSGAPHRSDTEASDGGRLG